MSNQKKNNGDLPLLEQWEEGTSRGKCIITLTEDRLQHLLEETVAEKLRIVSLFDNYASTSRRIQFLIGNREPPT